jgi:tetratricopeptide (TPR) repeat protein
MRETEAQMQNREETGSLPTSAPETATSSESEDLLTRALVAHQAGRLDEARELYSRKLAINSNDAKSLHGLGLMAYQMGRLEIAASMMQRAIAVDAKHAAYHFGLSLVRRKQRRLDEALLEVAVALLLDPQNKKLHSHAADVLCEERKWAEAEKHYKRALELDPNCIQTHQNLGIVLRRLGKLREAKACFQRMLELKPDSVVALHNLGNVLVKEGKLEEAQGCYERTLELKPDLAESSNSLGSVLQRRGKLDEAEARYRQALALKPGFPEAICNLGNLARRRGAPEEARAHYTDALSLNPDMAEAHSNLGMVLQGEGRLQEARQLYDRAVELDPAVPDARWNRCLLDLLEGKFETGWRDYEVRRLRRQSAPRFLQGCPVWRGEPLNGARILLYAEQGVGDTLHFLRYVSMVQAVGGTVILDVPASLVRLAAQIAGVTELVASGDPLPPVDWHCPLMSLPLAFQTNLDSIPRGVPYLRVPEECRNYAQGAPPTDRAIRVGLVWSGNPEFAEDKLRSIPLPTFAPVLRVKGLQFYSLQFGPAASQLKEVDAPIVDLTASIKDFADTAALVEKLDLVISVDTAAAHLAGALAKPVWTLLPFAPDWRWMLDREDSPWYPTMRLFRQPQLGDWASVIERVRGDLARMSGQV